MTELLTRAEYAALAAATPLPAAPFIDGRFAAGAGDAMPTLNPATGETLAAVAAAGASDVDRAVEKARDAVDGGDWARAHPSRRTAVLIKLAKLMTRDRRALAVMESLDAGKPIADCERIDVAEAITCLLWHAEAADKLYDQTAPAGEDAIAMIVREPVGVVSAVLPWNFPLLMLAWKIAPALAAGNAVIVKPAEQTPLTALRVAELFAEAGGPRGVLQVLPGDGPVVGQALGLHPGVDMVAFTGSTETGKRFLRYSADSNLKRVTLECGGKNPAVVLSGADRLDSVAEHIVNAAFWNAGQNCSAASRLIVHKTLKAALLEKVAARLREWRVGDPLDPATRMGALIDAEHREKVAGYLTGDVLTGDVLVGGAFDGPYLPPTIIDGVKPGDRLAREEVFGPVLAVIEAASDAEAVAIANDTDYGLTASVFTADGRAALRAARAIRAGTVTVNSYGEGDAATPFGGCKQSGFGGRDNGAHAHEQYTELKTIWLDLTEPAAEEDLP